jgi:hypothetical protein
LQCLKRNINKRWIPTDYDIKFQQANIAFLHQWVYDMDETDYVRLNPLPKDMTESDINFLGKKPVVKDLTLLRVNKIIPKKKDETKSVSESTSATVSIDKATTLIAPASCIVSSITQQVIAYIDSVKENIEPHDYHARYHTTVKSPFTSNDTNKDTSRDTSKDVSKDTRKKQELTVNTPDMNAIQRKRRYEFLFDTQSPPPPADRNNGRRKRCIVSLY